MAYSRSREAEPRVRRSPGWLQSFWRPRLGEGAEVIVAGQTDPQWRFGVGRLADMRRTPALFQGRAAFEMRGADSSEQKPSSHPSS